VAKVAGRTLSNSLVVTTISPIWSWILTTPTRASPSCPLWRRGFCWAVCRLYHPQREGLAVALGQRGAAIRVASEQGVADFFRPRGEAGRLPFKRLRCPVTPEVAVSSPVAPAT
jgi:hypothetical protein